MDADYLAQLVQRGLISPDVLERMTEGEPQRQSRGQILQQGLDSARDYLTPSYFRDTPSSPQADRALADPNGRPGKIGPPSGPPTMADMLFGFAGDVASSALPFGKMLGAGLAKWLAANGILWKPAEVETLRKMVQSGTLDMEQLPGRTKSAADAVMTKLGLRLTESPNYVGTGDIVSDPRMRDRIVELLSQKKTNQEIADDIGVNESSIRKFKKNYLNIAPAERPAWNDPETIADYKDMVGKNYSQERMARKRGVNVGTVSKQLARLREAGHLHYTPGGGTRTPYDPGASARSRQGEAPDLESGQDFAKALAAFMPQYR